MPMAYSATTFIQKWVLFADKVRDYTGGDINITVHPGGSLFKGGEIKRAIQTGQAPIGERYVRPPMKLHFGWDNLPRHNLKEQQAMGGWDMVNAQLSDLNLVALYTCHGLARVSTLTKL